MAGPPRRHSKRVEDLLKALGIWLILVVIVTYVGLLSLGHREPDGLDVQNRTDTELLVYQILPDGPPVLQAEVPPGSTVNTGIECASDQMVARMKDGTLVAQRGPFEDCSMEDWVIRGSTG